MKRFLVFEDGTVFSGTAFGADVETIGEVVFNTGMSGYQETITDQSYNGQIINFTCPMIGNYGIAKKFNESPKPTIRGVLAREITEVVGNYQSEATIDTYLKEEGIPGIKGIDTRAVTLKIRDKGDMKAAIVNTSDAKIVNEIATWKLNKEQLKDSFRYKVEEFEGRGKHVVLLDYGFKQSIVRELIARDLKVTCVPGNYKFEAIKALSPDGILLSNGPGDPTDHNDCLATIRELQENYPVFGICMGHQLLSLANGASTFKMKFGHRGFNHPVRNLATNKLYFTAQNHGYAVDEKSLENTDLEVTQVELNDGSVEGVRHNKYQAFSVQYHPDATPGPHDAGFMFDEFVAVLNKIK